LPVISHFLVGSLERKKLKIQQLKRENTTRESLIIVKWNISATWLSSPNFIPAFTLDKKKEEKKKRAFDCVLSESQ
jgi:hypothetical protein